MNAMPQAPQAPKAPPTPKEGAVPKVIVNGPTGDVVISPDAAPKAPESGDAVIEVGDGVKINPDNVMHTVENIAYSFFLMVGVIVVSVTFARLLGRRWAQQANALPAAVPNDLAERLTRIENAVDAVSLEVERIAEGQRFTTKLLSERGEGAALPGRELR
jgi:hypothetical protein